MDFIKDLLPADNAVFQGGFGLAVVAAGASMARAGAGAATTMARRHLLVTLEVTSKDRSYPWVLQWLAGQGTRTQHLSVETSLRPARVGSMSSLFGFVPGPGQHFISYKGQFMSVQRVREQSMVDLQTGKPWEKVQFIGLGKDTTAFESILAEAHDMAMQKEEGKTIVYSNWGSEWRPFGQPRTRRPLESVILAAGQAERIFDDVMEWRASAEWYLARGIPYRRGYLLHGPPGSGKSSFIFALAGALGYNICVLNLAEAGLTDDRLALALANVPPQSVVLLEDIDAAFPSRSIDPSANSGTSSVTLSGLLNVLDGVASSEERLLFMTTNHMNRLDPALIRPGRVDSVERIGDCTPHQAEGMYRKFFPGPQNEEAAGVFGKRLSELGEGVPVSMAALQGYFLQHKEDPVAALEGLHVLYHELSSRSADGGAVMDYAADVVLKREAAVRHAKRGPLSPDQVDRMPFNPQGLWDADLESDPASAR
jgi:chaperone BCS1